MDDIAPALLGLSIMATVFGLIYFYLSFRNKERMALIESGADADLFYAKKNKKKTTPFTLSIGLVSIGLAVGISLAFIIEKILIDVEQKDPNHEYPQIYFAMIFLFVGLALVKAYQLSRKYEKEDNGKEE
jgi:F0F1-type ATP synthase assembly protein I